jgi:two-component system, chemotaxis family, response regulator Rcp1
MSRLYKNVFLIDDSKMDISLIREAFDENELIHKVNHFTDSTKFISYIQDPGYWQNTPDLILLDWNMPKADGQELTRILRSSTRYKNVPIIILSGLSDERLKNETTVSGADDYFRKPSDYEGWVKLIGRINDCWLEKEYVN